MKKKLIVLMIAALTLSGCSSKNEIAISQSTNNSEKVFNKGDSVKITFDEEELQGVEIKGLGVALHKNDSGKTINLDKSGIYDVIGVTSDTTSIKVVLTVK